MNIEYPITKDGMYTKLMDNDLVGLMLIGAGINSLPQFSFLSLDS